MTGTLCIYIHLEQYEGTFVIQLLVSDCFSTFMLKY